MSADDLETGLARRLTALRTDLRRRDPAVLAANTAAVQQPQRLLLTLWGQPVHIGLPDFIAVAADGTPLDPLGQALIAYYLFTSDGTPPAGRWLAMTDLPDGRFYTRAFQSYTGAPLARCFGDDLEWFTACAQAAGGRRHPFAAPAYLFSALPRLNLLLVCWPGDEDFPASYKILFDAHAQHHLPTDGCAIIGSAITGKLIKLAAVVPRNLAKQRSGGPS